MEGLTKVMHVKHFEKLLHFKSLIVLAIIISAGVIFQPPKNPYELFLLELGLPQFVFY